MTATALPVNRIDRDTTVCLSLSGRPSNIGTRFHNHLYAQLGLNFIYKAFTTSDLPAAIAGIRGLGIRGAGVSMPYKEACIPLLDEIHPSAAVIESVNTVVNDGGRLTGYNTDYTAIAQLLTENNISPHSRATVLGSGGMAKAVVAALRDHGLRQVSVAARNAITGSALAERYGFEYRTFDEPIETDVLVNATPIGMAGDEFAELLPVPVETLDAVAGVFDVVAFPARTPLVRAAEERGLQVISGAEVISRQALEQFVLYTGIRPAPEQVTAAAEYSRT